MRRYIPVKFAALCLFLSACVTINVYFPAAAAEKAADRIIEDVWGPAKKPTPENRPQTSSGTPATAPRVLLAAAGSALEFLIPSAHAQADLNIATPQVRAITQSMEARHAQLKPYYDSGAVGFTNDGMIDVRDQNLIPLPERNGARKLVADENSDRGNLYREIAKANGHPEWEADIRKTFAQRWVERASGGWYYKDGSGAWKQK
ncbi:MAG: YdbL family protein [Steroidobacteraceae bacterium]